ncbi:MAG: ABC transporter substrate-binding protein [Roseiflexaceae bacterium]|nr:helical backbone metal receptor [Chloroflexaceae bacterium]
MKHIVIRLLMCLGLVLVACTPATSSSEASTPVVATAQPERVAPATIRDGAGREVTIPATVGRVVSLAPSTTEIVYVLGKGDTMQAVDMFSDFPADVAALPKISNPDMTYNYEQIATLKPDVVFAAAITSPDAITAIEKLGITVVVVGTFTTTMASVQADIRLVGTVLGVTDAATALNEQMQARWDQIAAKVATVSSKPKVFWELDATDPSKPYTVGKGSFISDIIATAGAVNVFADVDNPYPQVSIEQVVIAAPDIIILSDAAYGVTAEQVVARPGWQTIPAVQQNAIYPIDDNLVSRPGPRIVEGLAAVVAIVHPEVK